MSSINNQFARFTDSSAFESVKNQLSPKTITFIDDLKSIFLAGTYYGTPITLGENEGVLTLTSTDNGSAHTLKTQINFSIDSTAGSDGKKYLRLTGANGADLGKVDIAEFVKDGMLNSASFNEANHKLTLTFNTDSGKDAIEVDLSKLVDVYDGANLKLNSVAIPETYSAPAAGDSVDSAIANLIKKDSELKGAIDTLEANQLTIEKGTDGNFVTTTVTAKADNKQKVSVAVTTAEVATATADANGLATANDVKTYITAQIADAFDWYEQGDPIPE